jgi:hypothetical protein
MKSQKNIQVRLHQIERAREAYERALRKGDAAALQTARLTLYLQHGCPLGGRMRSLEIWEEYATCATNN